VALSILSAPSMGLRDTILCIDASFLSMVISFLRRTLRPHNLHTY